MMALHSIGLYQILLYKEVALTEQAPVAQAHAGFDVQAAFVGATVQLRVVHALQYGAVDVRLVAAGVKNAGNAAHGNR